LHDRLAGIIEHRTAKLIVTARIKINDEAGLRADAMWRHPAIVISARLRKGSSDTLRFRISVKNEVAFAQFVDEECAASRRRSKARCWMCAAI
jgi:hypothetical protein